MKSTPAPHLITQCPYIKRGQLALHHWQSMQGSEIGQIADSIKKIVQKCISKA